MIPLRIAFDMDGTLADLHSAYAEVEERLFGAAEAEHERPAPEVREVEQHAERSARAAEARPPGRRQTAFSGVAAPARHRDRVWQAIEATPDFWTTLRPMEPAPSSGCIS